MAVRRERAGAAAPDRLSASALSAHAFECIGGPTFVLKTNPDETVDVILPDGVHRLARQPASDPDLTVWNKGPEATLTVAGAIYACRENRARSIREDARRRGVEFRGTGNEPGWVLELLPHRIVFSGGHGASPAVVPRTSPTVDAATVATLYAAVTEAHRLRVRIEARECSDSMSGERFGAAVEVELDGSRYRGCGYGLR